MRTVFCFAFVYSCGVGGGMNKDMAKRKLYLVFYFLVA